MRAISIERARRTVMEATTSPRASFSFTLLRTISRGDADMAFLRGDCSLLYARGHEGIRDPVGPGRDPLRYRNPGRAGPLDGMKYRLLWCMFAELQFRSHSTEPAHAQPRRACRPHPDRADFPPVGNRQDRALRPDPGVHG